MKRKRKSPSIEFQLSNVMRHFTDVFFFKVAARNIFFVLLKRYAFMKKFTHDLDENFIIMIKTAYPYSLCYFSKHLKISSQLKVNTKLLYSTASFSVTAPSSSISNCLKTVKHLQNYVISYSDWLHTLHIVQCKCYTIVAAIHVHIHLLYALRN
jgi:hypothetical protein